MMTILTENPGDFKEDFFAIDFDVTTIVAVTETFAFVRTIETIDFGGRGFI